MDVNLKLKAQHVYYDEFSQHDIWSDEKTDEFGTNIGHNNIHNALVKLTGRIHDLETKVLRDAEEKAKQEEILENNPFVKKAWEQYQTARALALSTGEYHDKT